MATDQLPALPGPTLEGHPYELWGQNVVGDFYVRGLVEKIQRDAFYAGKRAAIAADHARAVPVAWREAFEAAMRDAWECADPLHPPGQPGSYARGSWQGMQDGLATLRNNFELRLREAARPRAPEQPADLSGQAATNPKDQS